MDAERPLKRLKRPSGPSTYFGWPQRGRGTKRVSKCAETPRGQAASRFFLILHVVDVNRCVTPVAARQIGAGVHLPPNAGAGDVGKHREMFCLTQAIKVKFALSASAFHLSCTGSVPKPLQSRQRPKTGRPGTHLLRRQGERLCREVADRRRRHTRLSLCDVFFFYVCVFGFVAFVYFWCVVCCCVLLYWMDV